MNSAAATLSADATDTPPDPAQDAGDLAFLVIELERAASVLAQAVLLSLPHHDNPVVWNTVSSTFGEIKQLMDDLVDREIDG